MKPNPTIELDPQRCFSKRQKAEMFHRSGGRCEVKGCGRKIGAGEIWTAGHFPRPWALGGRTVIKNGRVECSDCAPDTQREDTSRAAKARRQGGETGQQKRRRVRKEEGKPPLIQNRGFQSWRKFNGEIVRKDD